MGRIPDHLVDEIIQRTDLVQLITLDVPLKKKGRYFFGLCPFHTEKTASFSVDPLKQIYYCHGCHATGTAVQYLMAHRHFSFQEAVEELARPLGIVIQAEKDEETNKRSVYFACLQEASMAYQKALQDHPLKGKAVQYLKGRGLTGHIAKRFQLGYAPKGGLGFQSAAFNGSLEDKKLLGLIKTRDDGQIRDTFSDRVIFPIRDVRGRVMGFGGRALAPDFQGPKYLNSPESPIFHKRFELYGLHEALAHQSKIHYLLVVEGYLDVIALAQMGIPSAIATLGTAIGADHLEKALRYTGHIIFCFDGDEAGSRAAEKALLLSAAFLSEGRTFSFMILPEGEDPDSFVRKCGKDAFEVLMKEAPPWPDFLLSHLKKNTALNSLEGRIQLASQLKSWADKIADPTYRALFLEQLPSEWALPRELLVPPASTTPAVASPAPPVKVPRASTLQRNKPRVKLSTVERALGLCLKKPGLLDQLSPERVARFQSTFPAPPFRLDLLDADFPILWRCIQLVQQEGMVTFDRLAALFEAEGKADQVAFLVAQDFALPEAYWAEELRGALDRVREEYEAQLQFAHLLSSLENRVE